MDELNAKEFIFNFFDKNFLIHVNDEGSKFELKDKRTNTILSEYEFFSFVGVVFVGLVPNDFIGIKTVTEEWYNQHKKNLIRDIQDVFDKCIVILGKTSWEIMYEDGTLIKEKDIVKMFFGKYSSGLIRKVFNDWYDEKIVTESEKIMGI